MKAMIMSAGKGTRLGEITRSMPKVLVDINGKSLLQHAVEYCCSYGFDDIIVNVHYLADMVEEEIKRINAKGFRISVSDERELLLENGGGLYKARHFFDKNPFLVYNADIVTDLDLSLLLDLHLEKKALATLAVRERPGSRFLLTDKDGVLRGWRNVSTGEEILKADSNEGLKSIGFSSCLLYTSDAADDLLCVDLGGRRIIKKKNLNLKAFFDTIVLYSPPTRFLLTLSSLSS